MITTKEQRMDELGWQRLATPGNGNLESWWIPDDPKTAIHLNRDGEYVCRGDMERIARASAVLLPSSEGVAKIEPVAYDDPDYEEAK